MFFFPTTSGHIRYKRESRLAGLLVHLACLPQDGGTEQQVCDAVLALAVCHNVTPVLEEEWESTAAEQEQTEDEEEVVVFSRENGKGGGPRMSYQASSPDEVGEAGCDVL